MSGTEIAAEEGIATTAGSPDGYESGGAPTGGTGAGSDGDASDAATTVTDATTAGMPATDTTTAGGSCTGFGEPCAAACEILECGVFGSRFDERGCLYPPCSFKLNCPDDGVCIHPAPWGL